ncbi:hydrolase 1, exosortase A system-associated [Motiliproteus sediminis]|uniref:hydrolase 1, exosortase A system-associated n=1 Tax=Motiliproteus sediminis TaxID=1468178 RepID=UPI001AF0025C|nr:hydrolase 1, exosortase A system-associated [Motiliproteus sediminis]
MFNESALTFECDQRRLAAILHAGDSEASVGVVVVVGGPQYRVGSHRQFVHLARHLADKGIPTLRFDVTGMGDSAGEKRPFDQLDADLRAAVDALLQQQPQLQGVVLWGLCDGASAALLYAPRDRRIKGLVLVNPWLEDAQAQAQARLWDYYLKRLLSVDFWRKFLRGKVAVGGALGELGHTVAQSQQHTKAEQCVSYQQRMLSAFSAIQIPVQLLLCGEDLTAREFEYQFNHRADWRRPRKDKQINVVSLPDADHTCSTRQWKQQLAEHTLGFVSAL